MQGKKKLKFTSKQNLAEPIDVDEVRLISACVDFRHGELVVEVALVDSAGGDEGTARIRGERPIHIGLDGFTGIDIDQFEQAILAVIGTCGVLPAGSKVEDK